MRPVLIIQNEWTNPVGYLDELLQTKDIAYDISKVEEEPLPALGNYAAIIALGGSQHIYERQKYPYFNTEETLIRQIVQQNIPFLGICLGAQLLASALDGTVKKHSDTEIGFYDIPLTPEGMADPLYAGFSGYHKVFHWHEDTFELPHSSTLLASNTITTNQAFRYGQYAYGVQYHIELTPAMLHHWLSYFDSPENELDKDLVDAILQDSHHQFAQYRIHTRMMFENFLHICDLA